MTKLGWRQKRRGQSWTTHHHWCTSVSPSTKVEEVQEKGVVQDHPPWRVNRVYLCEYMEEGEEVKRKPKEFPLHWQRNQFKWAVEDCLDRCYEKACRTGIEPTAELVEVYALKVLPRRQESE